jgi:hypothetical protein
MGSSASAQGAPAAASMAASCPEKMRGSKSVNHAKLKAIQRLVTYELTDDTLTSEVPHLLLDRWRAGDTEAMNELLPLIYEELRQVARRHLRGQRDVHTLQTTALIHEAYRSGPRLPTTWMRVTSLRLRPSLGAAGLA